MSGSSYGRPPRGLSLTEELDRLDQSITLTLQQIDENFNRSLRIVTEKILPVVEQYGKQSGDVWEGSKFWKQFFEASANVSLSGYEENPTVLDTTEQSTLQNEETSTDLHTLTDFEDDENTARLGRERGQGSGKRSQGVFDQESDIDLSSPTQMTGTVGTPRLPASALRGNTSRSGSATGKSKAAAAKLYRSPSPRKYTGSHPFGSGHSRTTPGLEEPSTPSAIAGTGAGLVSSPFEPDSAFKPSTAKRQPTSQMKGNKDPVMHWQVLDKNYRIQATPMTQRRQRQDHVIDSRSRTTPASTNKSKALWEDSPESSPEIERPQLRSDLFSPPRDRSNRTPGVSVLTPMQESGAAHQQAHSTGRRLFTSELTAPSVGANNTHTNRLSNILDETLSDDGIDYELSPPKTMQFHVPQSRLVQTPAREASRKIVEDLLLTAGADGTTDIEAEGEGVEEPSPSVVRRGWEMEDDTF
ncbi:hypothetical protein K431DRAFT_283129 [Polychaeton citri CBS 116435]|uniref:DASH complex subunit ASK1 n=1 Tax=Polychaeton citri CBS 116435 TaxID=1314669 RepID=A0A9P4QCS4_9PEZI|nr:hypothetical protein K431DRAFT_283129 [Polychaeton citri CBS 116435]